MTCVSCLRGFHDECDNCTNCHTKAEIPVTEITFKQETEKTDELQWQKDDVNVRDPQSTGRKRAAKLFPLDSSLKCEWSDASEDNPKGGGERPIREGCSNFQQARHHGPDKNTLNNSEGNVHRICHHHHVKWHWDNDEERQSLVELATAKEH